MVPAPFHRRFYFEFEVPVAFLILASVNLCGGYLPACFLSLSSYPFQGHPSPRLISAASLASVSQTTAELLPQRRIAL